MILREGIHQGRALYHPPADEAQKATLDQPISKPLNALSAL